MKNAQNLKNKNSSTKAEIFTCNTEISNIYVFNLTDSAIILTILIPMPQKCHAHIGEFKIFDETVSEFHAIRV